MVSTLLLLLPILFSCSSGGISQGYRVGGGSTSSFPGLIAFRTTQSKYDIDAPVDFRIDYGHYFKQEWGMIQETDENAGKLLENMIALEILKDGKEVYYFKNNVECDFIIQEKNKFTPVQVCFSLQNTDTKKREIKGLLSACEFFNVNTGYIVTFDEENVQKISNCNIEIIPAYKFILDILGK